MSPLSEVEVFDVTFYGTIIINNNCYVHWYKRNTNIPDYFSLDI
jgi:hypothetical protein